MKHSTEPIGAFATLSQEVIIFDFSRTISTEASGRTFSIDAVCNVFHFFSSAFFLDFKKERCYLVSVANKWCFVELVLFAE